MLAEIGKSYYICLRFILWKRKQPQRFELGLFEATSELLPTTLLLMMKWERMRLTFWWLEAVDKFGTAFGVPHISQHFKDGYCNISHDKWSVKTFVFANVHVEQSQLFLQTINKITQITKPATYWSKSSMFQEKLSCLW